MTASGAPHEATLQPAVVSLIARAEPRPAMDHMEIVDNDEIARGQGGLGGRLIYAVPKEPEGLLVRRCGAVQAVVILEAQASLARGLERLRLHQYCATCATTREAETRLHQV